ncbi:MAG: TIGR03118 family protein, partial [Isosphaeraceae bacterium]|nr:TIGR03118 family protein [Isosphaeraceae bacterium]
MKIIRRLARSGGSAIRPNGRRKPRVARSRFELEELEPRALLSITAEFGKIAAAEGTPNTNVVATFTSDDSVAASSFVASIVWGDGSTSAGTVSPVVGGGFQVTGTHTYAVEGTLDASVQIGDGVSQAPVTGDADVSPAMLTISAVPIGAALGTPVTTEVATFTDTNPNARASDFTAMVNWGDATTSSGSVAEVNGVFQVTGTHAYQSVGRFPIVVSVEGEGSFATTGFGNEVNLVSDVPGLALTTDPQLLNPWGLTPTGEFWISDNGSGLSTLYNAAGVKAGLVVSIPTPPGQTTPAAPTGIVAGTGSSSGEFLLNGKPAAFIFDTEDGTISAWNGGTAATLEVDNSQVNYGNGVIGAVYKGLAVASQGGTNNDFLYATNFRSGNVDVFNNKFQAAGSFTDTSLTQIGYAPFGIQAINGNLFVSFAKQDSAKHDDVAGAGNGYIDEFSPNGTLLRRFASNGTLNSPWGLTVAPAGFGQFAGDLLVGNFGDGRINAFNLTTGHLDGQLTAAGASSPITIPSLWALQFGGGGGSPTTLNFTEGLNSEADGVFGTIAPTAQAEGTATVFDAPITIHAVAIHATSGMPFTGDVATFTVTNPNAVPSDFTPTIDWGDGVTTGGTVTEVGSVFHISGTHNYALPGSFPAIVSVHSAQSVATTGFGDQTNLVSNIPGLAGTTDPALANPWGISFTPTSAFWIADNATGLSTLYNGAGAKIPLTVTIPPPAGQAGPSAPTGTVANTNASEFLVNGTAAAFLFDTEDGTISAWNGGTSAVLEVDNSQEQNANGTTGAVYKGLAVASRGKGNSDFLFATNFRSGNVDVFDNQFHAAGSFTDTSLIALGYAPFGIQNIGGNLFVTFAKQDAAKHDDVAGAGNGYIDVFSPTGVMLQRFASNGALVFGRGRDRGRPRARPPGATRAAALGALRPACRRRRRRIDRPVRRRDGHPCRGRQSGGAGPKPRTGCGAQRRSGSCRL